MATANRGLRLACQWAAAVAFVFSGCATAQQVVTPTKVTRELHLDQGNPDGISRCGIHWANVVADGNKIMAYQINIEGWFLSSSKQSSTAIWASLRTTTVGPSTSTHVDTAPSDIYLFIQQDEATYRIQPTDTFGANWFGGLVDAGGVNGDSAKALAPTMAMMKNIPMLVYLVFDNPSGQKTTLVFNTVNDLSKEQDIALSDCVARSVKRQMQ